MLCSDGFRHCISQQEIYEFLNPNILKNKEIMDINSNKLINIDKQRMEKDNLSVVLIKAY